MHIALQLMPKCLAQLTAIEALLSGFNLVSTTTGMEQEEDGGFGIFHTVQNEKLLLTWSLGFAPLDEGEEPDDAGPCVMVTITLFATTGDTCLTLIDLTYSPEEDGGWRIDEVAWDSEYFASLAQDAKVQRSLTSPDTDDEHAFILINAMARLLTGQRTPLPLIN